MTKTEVHRGLDHQVHHFSDLILISYLSSSHSTPDAFVPFKLFLNKAGPIQLRGLCTCCSLCLEYSSRYPHTSSLHVLSSPCFNVTFMKASLNTLFKNAYLHPHHSRPPDLALQTF